MDTLTRVSSSFDSFGDTLSSTASAARLVEPTDGGSSDEVNSCASRDIRAELTEMRLVLESCEYTLAEQSNQLSKMMDDLKTKDHQLMINDQQLESRDRRIVDLETQLVDIQKGWMKEVVSVHSRVYLFLKSKKECRQLQRRCQFLRSRALAKPDPPGGASQGEHSS